jgi:hypothetical protein
MPELFKPYITNIMQRMAQRPQNSTPEGQNGQQNGIPGTSAMPKNAYMEAQKKDLNLIIVVMKELDMKGLMDKVADIVEEGEEALNELQVDLQEGRIIQVQYNAKK